MTVVSSFEIFKYVFSLYEIVKSPFQNFVGKKKEDYSFVEAQKRYIKKVINNKELLPADYKYFGNGNQIENLRLYLLNNAFFAQSLTSTTNLLGFVDSFQIDTLNEKTWYGRLVATLDSSYPRYSAKFDANLNLISIYDPATKKEVIDPVEKQKAAGDLLFLIIYAGQTTHAVVHILHLMLGTGIYVATKHDPSFLTWSAPYSTNLYLKYEEVELYLLHPKFGALTGRIYRSNAQKVLGIAKDLIETWSASKTADDFISDYLLSGLGKAGIKHFKAIGGLEQFFSQASLIHDYAKELTQALKETNSNSYYYTNSLIRSYYSRVGTHNSVKDLKQWIELISVTGLFHGSTLSTTRLILTDEIFKLFPKGDKYEYKDNVWLKVMFATINGMINGFHVFPSRIQRPHFFNSDAQLKPLVEQVLLKYDSLSADKKVKYFKKISADKNFNKYGFVWTDYGLDGIDAKQLTVTTYI
jgi:hypothetical protein